MKKTLCIILATTIFLATIIGTFIYINHRKNNYKIADLSKDTSSDTQDTSYDSITQSSDSETNSETNEEHVHTIVIDPAVVATCLTSGKTEGKHCSTCGEILVGQKPISALWHDFSNKIDVAVECTKDGYSKNLCSRCNDEYIYILECSGHSWGEWETISDADCTTDGKKQRKCSVCNKEEKQSIPMIGHNYVIIDSFKENEELWFVNQCITCLIEKNIKQGSVEESNQFTNLYNVSSEFSFFVYFEGTEDDIKNKLKIINANFENTEYCENDNVVQKYSVSKKENNLWNIAPISPYRSGGRFLVTLGEGISFSEYSGNKLTFTVEKEETLNIEFYENIKFLKVMEENDPGYYPYQLMTSEHSQYFYLNLQKPDGLSIGDLICIGDIANEKEYVTSTNRECLFGRIVDIVSNSETGTMIVLTSPHPEEVFKKFEIYKSDKLDISSIDSEILRAAEEEILLSITKDEDYVELLTSLNIASNQFLANRGYQEYQLYGNAFTDHVKLDFKFNDPSSEENPLNNGILKGTLTGEYKRPIGENGVDYGSLKITFSVEVTFDFNYTTNIQNWEELWHGECYFKIDQTTTLEFNFNIDFSMSYSTQNYILNTKTDVLHDASCSAISSKSDFVYLYISKSDLLKQKENGAKECQRCKPISRLSNTSFFINQTSGTYHTATCSHVTSSMSITSLDASKLNESYSACKDCRPDLSPRKEFEELMKDSLNYADWEDTFNTMKATLSKGDASSFDKKVEILKPKYIPIATVLMGKIGIYLTFDFDLSASFSYNFKYTQTNGYGIRLRNYGIFDHDVSSIWDDPKSNITQSLEITGEAKIRAGAEVAFNVSIAGFDQWYIGLSARAGVYLNVSGSFKWATNKAPEKTTYLEYGIYIDILATYDIPIRGYGEIPIFEHTIPISNMGYDKVFYAFEKENPTFSVNRFTGMDLSNMYYDFNGSEYLNVKYISLKNNTSGVETLNFNSSKYRLSMSLEKGEHCTLSANGLLILHADAPEYFTDKLRVQITDCGEASFAEYMDGKDVYLIGELVINIVVQNIDPPTDAVEFNGHYYKIYELGDMKTYTDVITFCSKLDGHLATITSEEEDEFLFSYMQSLGYKNAFFGNTDVFSEGDWMCITGEASSYENFSKGEPNNEWGDEDFAMYYWKYPDGKWNDGKIGRGYGDVNTFICEWSSMTIL